MMLIQHIIAALIYLGITVGVCHLFYLLSKVGPEGKDAIATQRVHDSTRGFANARQIHVALGGKRKLFRGK